MQYLTLAIENYHTNDLLSLVRQYCVVIAYLKCVAIFDFLRLQTILVSGDSGPGKTESTRCMMQYLTLAIDDYYTHDLLLLVRQVCVSCSNFRRLPHK